MASSLGWWWSETAKKSRPCRWRAKSISSPGVMSNARPLDAVDRKDRVSVQVAPVDAVFAEHPVEGGRAAQGQALGAELDVPVGVLEHAQRVPPVRRGAFDDILGPCDGGDIVKRVERQQAGPVVSPEQAQPLDLAGPDPVAQCGHGIRLGTRGSRPGEALGRGIPASGSAEVAHVDATVVLRAGHDARHLRARSETVVGVAPVKLQRIAGVASPARGRARPCAAPRGRGRGSGGRSPPSPDPSSESGTPPADSRRRPPRTRSPRSRSARGTRCPACC